MKLKFNYIISYSVLFIMLSGCVVEDRYLDEKSEPMLQVDATLFAGEPIREIKIRRVFDIHDSAPFQIDRSQLWAENATVRLYEINSDDSGSDSIMIPLREKPFHPGRFEPVDPDYRINSNMKYTLNVQWHHLSASATAQIPDFKIDDLKINTSLPQLLPDTLLITRDQIGFGPPPVDTLVVYSTQLKIEQFIPYNHVSYQIASLTEIEALLRYPRFRFDVRNPLNYQSVNIEENGNRFKHQQIMHGYFDANSSNDDRNKVVVRVVMIVPESIYGDYIEADPSYLVPVFVSNVEGGAGLFIGAVRDTVEVRVPILD